MEKFLTPDFAVLLLILGVLMVVHELGHYLAYRILGFEAVIRKSIFIPGIDPKETIEVNRPQGMLIALGGFIFSTLIIVLPGMLFDYKHWIVLLIGGLAGSVVDFIWAFSMLFMKRITIGQR